MNKPSCYLQIDAFATRSRRDQELRAVLSQKSLFYFAPLNIGLSADDNRWLNIRSLLKIACQRSNRLDWLGK